MGHTSSVMHVDLDERLNHLFTLSVDKTIKVRALRCRVYVCAAPYIGARSHVVACVMCAACPSYRQYM